MSVRVITILPLLSLRVPQVLGVTVLLRPTMYRFHGEESPPGAVCKECLRFVSCFYFTAHEQSLGHRYNVMERETYVREYVLSLVARSEDRVNLILVARNLPFDRGVVSRIARFLHR